jgi:cysteine desulfurase
VPIGEVTERYYLDNAATTAMSERAIETLIQSTNDHFGNSSSVHFFGERASDALEKSRTDLLKIFCPELSKNAHPNLAKEKIIFTSGGTESDNLGILGHIECMLAHGRKPPFRVAISNTEHSAVEKCAVKLIEDGNDVFRIPVLQNGLIDMDALNKYLDEAPPVLVSIHHVNNETGALQPIEEIATLIRKKAPKCFIHSDCVQSFGKVPVNFENTDLDAISISSHKIHGPKGMGALIVKHHECIGKLSYGGSHENDLRSGTVNVPGVVSFVDAAHECLEKMDKTREHCQKLKTKMRAELEKLPYEIKFLSEETAIPHILSIMLPKHETAILARMLDMRGFCISPGSACSAAKVEPNRVLMAMGYAEKDTYGGMRISFSLETPEEVCELFPKALKEALDNY